MKRFRLNVELSPTTLRKLILWAHTRDDKKNSWARTVLILRCDANEDKVVKWFENESKRLGISKEELENMVLEKEGFNVQDFKNNYFED